MFAADVGVIPGSRPVHDHSRAASLTPKQPFEYDLSFFGVFKQTAQMLTARQLFLRFVKQFTGDNRFVHIRHDYPILFFLLHGLFGAVVRRYAAAVYNAPYIDFIAEHFMNGSTRPKAFTLKYVVFFRVVQPPPRVVSGG